MKIETAKIACGNWNRMNAAAYRVAAPLAGEDHHDEVADLVRDHVDEHPRREPQDRSDRGVAAARHPPEPEPVRRTKGHSTTVIATTPSVVPIADEPLCVGRDLVRPVRRQRHGDG